MDGVGLMMGCVCVCVCLGGGCKGCVFWFIFIHAKRSTALK